MSCILVIYIFGACCLGFLIEFAQLCILAPKMIECAQHENITLLTYSEVAGVESSLGDFRVKVLKKARYIDEQKCTGCGECALKCPVKVDAEFDMGLRKGKVAIFHFYRQFHESILLTKIIES